MTHSTHSLFMKKAIESACHGARRLDGGPFGACIVKGKTVLAVSHNTVLKTNDPTCHAEINAIRAAAKRLKCFDLSGCVIYSTTEPCPMCFSAIHWARIGKVFYGTNIQDVKKRGFNELTVASSMMKRIGKSDIRIEPDFMKNECLALLKFWDKLPKKGTY